MALERHDKIKEETTTTGTGTVSLNGTAPTGFRTFVSAVTSGATVHYLIETSDQSEWEVGEGVFTDATPDTLTRVTVFASSNSGSLVSFSAGTKNVSLVLTALDVRSAYQLEEGRMLNGRITPSVASNNLTVALKTISGADPSASDPVFAMIGGSLRVVTSALSVTKNAGTNWMNAGSSELATQEIDYFVYLGYNATDGVVIGFSRIPFANSYDDFSTTSTNEKYCAISTITNAAATDYYENIGRFAATLSAGSGYTWSVPTFTAKNLIQRPIWETRILTWSPVFTGFSTNPTGIYSYFLRGKKCYLNIENESGGTSNATSFIRTAPFTSVTKTNAAWAITNTGASDNGAPVTTATRSYILSNSSSIVHNKDMNAATWTAANEKSVTFSELSYEI